MTTKQIVVSHTNCPWCQGLVPSSPWRPELGIDPRLRKFECKGCGHSFYQILPMAAKKEYKERHPSG